MHTTTRDELDLLNDQWSPVELLIAEVLRVRARSRTSSNEELQVDAMARWRAYLDGVSPPQARWSNFENLLFGPRQGMPELPSDLRTARTWISVRHLIEFAATADPFEFPDPLLLLCDKYGIGLSSLVAP